GAGRVIIAAAGNEAAADIHASGTVANGGSTIVDFSVPGGSNEVILDLWYPGADQMGVKVTNPVGTPCPSSGFRYPGNATISCGQTTITTDTTNVTNGDNEIIIELSGSPVRSGTWTFTLDGVTGGPFDVWIDDVSSEATFMNPDPNKTVG